MEINFSLDVDNIGFPMVLLSASVNNKIVSVTADIASMMELIPLNILIEYRELAKNKVINLIETNQITFAGYHTTNIDLITKFLNSQEG